MARTYTAFLGSTQLAAGGLLEVALAAHAARDLQTEMPIVFDDASGQVVDLDLRGSAQDVAERLAPAPEEEPARPRGRPKLGVTAREITLLPRHWDWLQQQPGGASATLRRLVEQALHANAEGDARRAAQNVAYRVMHALAGHLSGYEEALRALFAGDAEAFALALENWPQAIADYVRRLAAPSFTIAS